MRGHRDTRVGGGNSESLDDWRCRLPDFPTAGFPRFYQGSSKNLEKVKVARYCATLGLGKRTMPRRLFDRWWMQFWRRRLQPALRKSSVRHDDITGGFGHSRDKGTVA
jgi:hypothetical protein